jgi:hypothetical protein
MNKVEPQTHQVWMTKRLTASQRRLLRALSGPCFLKSHRDLEGHKVYQLHPLHGPAEDVPPADVQALTDLGLIDSNKKFPAATYWLTAKGKALLGAE